MTISWCAECQEHHPAFDHARSPEANHWRHRALSAEAELAALRALLVDFEQEMRFRAWQDVNAHRAKDLILKWADKLTTLHTANGSQACEVDARD